MRWLGPETEVILIVDRGTTLEVIDFDREKDWYWVVLPPDLHGTRTVTLLALLLAACATPDTLTADAPRAEADFAIAPYQFHEECATLQAGDRIDYRFEAKSPVTFHLYYKDGIAFVAPITSARVRGANAWAWNR